MGKCFFWYRRIRVVADKGPLDGCRGDNGSAGHGSRVKWVNKSGSRVSTRDPLTHDFVFFSDIVETYGTA